MYAKNIWYVAAWRQDLMPGQPMAVEVAGEQVVLYRKSDGNVAALMNRCCHRAAPLSKGRIQGDNLRCMYHGLLFAPNGQCIEIPGQAQIPKRACVRSFAVIERDSWIWLWPGDAEQADTSLIPATHLEREGWAARRGYLDYAADYQLVNDNLCDFSHVAFVHETTVGQGVQEWAHELPTVTQLPNGLRIQRWIASGTPLPSEPNLLNGVRVDIWSEYEYVLPGILTMTVEYHPPGTVQALNRAPPTAADRPLWTAYLIQAVTPLDERRSRYFYSTSSPIDRSSEAGRDMFFDINVAAFKEDQVMINAQQRVMNEQPDEPFVNTVHDAGLMRFRRLIDARVAAENAERAAVKGVAASG